MQTPGTIRTPVSTGTHSMGARLRRAVLAPLAGFALAAVAAPAAAVPFTQGDLYLLSRELPAIGQGILRVDPAGGGTSVLVDLPDAEPVYATLSYDPFRDRLLFSNSTSPGVQTVDAAGATGSIPTAGEHPTLVAARGDGIVYLWIQSALQFRYLDGADAVHDLLDPGGSVAVAFPPGTQLQEMIYEPETQSLLCLSSNPFAPCTTAGWTCAVRIPLTPAGTQATGTLQWTQVDVSALSVEDVDGASVVPGGQVLVTVDTNDNFQQPRMQMLDPVGMTFSTYASNGPYTGAASTDAGTWSSIQGSAIILDSLNDRLLRFGSSETGNGTVFATGVSGSGSGEDARLVEITGPIVDPPASGPLGLAALASALAALALLALRRRPAAG